MPPFARQPAPRAGLALWSVRGAAVLLVLFAFVFALSSPDYGWAALSYQSALVHPPCEAAPDSSDEGGLYATPRPGKLPAGTIPMQHPSRETFEKVEANPGLPESDEAVAGEFVAAPWLLPPRTKALPYAGVHDLDELLRLRGSPQGKHAKAILITLFSRGIATMAQNMIYSMVKFGGVRNYVVGCWTPEDLAACADLNLPCADVSRFLAGKLENAGQPTRKDVLAIKWLRPALAAHALAAGYAVAVADADVAWTLKPVWDSLLGYAATADADGVMQEKYYNGGLFMLLPTPAAAAAAANWSSQAAAGLGRDEDDHALLAKDDGIMRQCSHPGCINLMRDEAKKAGQEGKVALLRSYHPGYRLVSTDACLMDKPGAPLLDFCDWAILHVHPCSPLEAKAEVYRRQGLWLVDSEEGCAPRAGTASQVAACRPLRWRVPDTEDMFYTCPAYGTALVHERPALVLPEDLAAEAAGGAGGVTAAR